MARTVSTVDYHTAGEPFRIVVGGAPPLVGDTVLDRRTWALEHADDVRQLLVNEPRGHADMYGCHVTPPDDDAADVGTVFFHKDGYSTACGHGTIALVSYLLESGQLRRDGDGVHEVVVDVPSGRLPTRATVRGGKVVEVVFRNVPSFVLDAAQVTVAGRHLEVPVSFGGAFYASVDATVLGLDLSAVGLPELIATGRAVKRQVEAACDVVHPEEERLCGVYGVVFHADEALDAVDEEQSPGVRLRQRNVTVFADGEVDRSPCGSGTSARLAVLHAEGRLRRGEALRHYGIAGGVFTASVVAEVEAAGRPAVVTEVGGSAFRTGHHTFVLEDGDPLGLGFQLR